MFRRQQLFEHFFGTPPSSFFEETDPFDDARERMFFFSSTTSQRDPFAGLRRPSARSKFPSSNSSSSSKVRRPLTVSLEELALGFTKQVAMPAPDGSVQWLPVVGQPGWRGGRIVPVAENMSVELVEAPHPRFSRDGDNLVTEVTVPLHAALCGQTFAIKGLLGNDLVFHLPLVTPETVHVFAGEGMPTVHGTRGDLLVKFVIQFPSQPLPEYQRNLLADILTSSAPSY